MSYPNRDLFDHDAHVQLLERASNELYRDGESFTQKQHRSMAAACGKAASIHRQLQGRVAHARQAERKLERLYNKLVASAPVVTGEKPINMEAAAREVHAIMRLLGGYVSQPNAPWITPAPVMFPLPPDPSEET